MQKYQIWNKQDSVLTPSGAIFTAEQWLEKYPIARLDSIVVVLAAGEINGALFATLGDMMRRAEADGCDFASCTTNEEKLQAIEDFEDARMKAQTEAAEQAAAEKAAQEEVNTTSLASIAASMEYQNMLTLEDEEVTA